MWRYYSGPAPERGTAPTNGNSIQNGENGLSVTNGYDEFLRGTNLSAFNGSTPLTFLTYGYDSASRLDTVSDGTNSATYEYLENSPLVAQIAFTNDGVQRMVTTKAYDLVNRLTQISSVSSVSSVVSFHYAYNTGSQRTSVTNADGSRWVYTYDSLGQVTSGKKYWSDGTPVAGQQFTYGFDDIGNRQTTGAGGDAAGGNLRSATYGANLLNQYTNRTVPGYVNMLGEATNPATVRVWTQDGWFPTTRQGAYFRAEVSANNSSGPVWLNITNLAALTNGSSPDIVTNVTGNVLVAKSPESFTHDADGNLTSDSLWTNLWNGENRRTVVESVAAVPIGAKAREEWTHLPDGRWIERIVSTNDGSAYYPAFTNRYVWDEQVLVAVLDHTNGLVMSFVRGLDLSGTPQGAGSAGGLLAVHSTLNSQPSTHFVAYDGNGNVTALISACDGSETARYEYGPFAEPLRLTGPLAKLNPIRFSSQYADEVTGDVKYLFRDYRPHLGRWLSRDPIGEDGGLNLYVFLENHINDIDPLGLCRFLGVKIYSGNKNISDLDKPYQPNNPFRERAEWSRKAVNDSEFVKRSHTQFPNAWDSVGPKLQGNAADPAHNVPADAFKAGHYLFFVVFDVCEDHGPCSLTVEESIHITRAGKVEPPDERPEGTVDPEGYVKVPNPNAPDNKTCCPKGKRTTIILSDAPGTVAYLKKIPYNVPYDIGTVNFKLFQSLSVGDASGPKGGVGHIIEFDIQ